MVVLSLNGINDGFLRVMWVFRELEDSDNDGRDTSIGEYVRR